MNFFGLFKWKPKPLDSFFKTRRCPDCGGREFWRYQDGGHDVTLECQKCLARFGIQEAPFNMIERIGRGKL